MARLGDVCSFFSGTGFPNAYQGQKTGKYPFYKVGDISENVLLGNRELLSSDNYIDDDTVQAIKGTVLPPKTVVFAKIGEALRLNRRAITNCNCLVDNNAMGILADNTVLDEIYFYYFMYSVDLQHYCESTTVPSVRKTRIAEIEIPLPSLEEQRRIAATLDKVSDLIAKRLAQLEKLDLLVKARFVELFGDPETNIKHWPVQPMSRVCSVGSSKRIYQSEQSSEGVPFWRVSNLTDLINTGIATADLYIPEERYNELKAQGQVPAVGDILVTSRGTLGQCYIVKENDVFYFQDGMISWLSKYSESITPLYLSYLFAMPGFRKQIESMQAGTTVPYLSIAMIKRLDVMIPSMEVQNRFNDFVRQTDKSKLTIQQSLDKLEILKKALMQKYFE